MTPAPRKKKPFYKDLFFQVIAGILLGVALGVVKPSLAVEMKPLADAFINLIKMLIAPIIFCTIVSGIAGMGDLKQVGRVGVKAVIYFEVITTLALILGLLSAHFFQPGLGMTIDASAVDTQVVKKNIAQTHMGSTADFFLGLIPHTFVGAFADGEILQVLLIAILFSVALSGLRGKARAVVEVIDGFSHVLFKMVDLVTLLAPVGAFGAMAFTVGKYGVGSLKELGSLILVFYLTGILFIALVLAPILKFYCRLSPLQFIKYLRDELLIVLGTSSSESVLPRMMEKLAALGCSKPVVGLVIPSGYSFNLDGSSLYFTMGALFIANATHTPLDLWQELTLLGVLLITSKGAAGVTGSGFIVLAATLASMDLFAPGNLELGLALIFAIDRFMSTGRALVNLIGNGIATVVVARWEKQLDHALAADVLAGRREPDLALLEK